MHCQAQITKPLLLNLVDIGPFSNIKQKTLCRFVAPLQAAHIRYQPHLFVETENAPPESIAELVNGVAKEVGCTLIAVARSNKVRSAFLLID